MYKISVLTPSYNSGKYIERAITSVMAQTYSNWEHIIVDGGSKDETIAILKKYPHLVWISESDQGQSDAMNKAFNRSSGDLIVYLNSDDELEKDVFVYVVNFFSSNIRCNVLIGNLIQVIEGKMSLQKPESSLLKILNYRHFLFPLNSVSYYYRRNVQESIGSFPIHNFYAMDYWFLLEMYKRYRIHKIDRVFGYFHFTPGNKSSHAEDALRALQTVAEDFVARNKFLYFKIRLRNKLRTVFQA